MVRVLAVTVLCGYTALVTHTHYGSALRGCCHCLRLRFTTHRWFYLAVAIYRAFCCRFCGSYVHGYHTVRLPAVTCLGYLCPAFLHPAGCRYAFTTCGSAVAVGSYAAFCRLRLPPFVTAFYHTHHARSGLFAVTFACVALLYIACRSLPRSLVTPPFICPVTHRFPRTVRGCSALPFTLRFTRILHVYLPLPVYYTFIYRYAAVCGYVYGSCGFGSRAFVPLRGYRCLTVTVYTAHTHGYGCCRFWLVYVYRGYGFGLPRTRPVWFPFTRLPAAFPFPVYAFTCPLVTRAFTFTHTHVVRTPLRAHTRYCTHTHTDSAVRRLPYVPAVPGYGSPPHIPSRSPVVGCWFLTPTVPLYAQLPAARTVTFCLVTRTFVCYWTRFWLTLPAQVTCGYAAFTRLPAAVTHVGWLPGSATVTPLHFGCYTVRLLCYYLILWTRYTPAFTHATVRLVHTHHARLRLPLALHICRLRLRLLVLRLLYTRLPRYVTRSRTAHTVPGLHTRCLHMRFGSRFTCTVYILPFRLPCRSTVTGYGSYHATTCTRLRIHAVTACGLRLPHAFTLHVLLPARLCLYLTDFTAYAHTFTHVTVTTFVRWFCWFTFYRYGCHFTYRAPGSHGYARWFFAHLVTVPYAVRYLSLDCSPRSARFYTRFFTTPHVLHGLRCLHVAAHYGLCTTRTHAVTLHARLPLRLPHILPHLPLRLVAIYRSPHYYTLPGSWFNLQLCYTVNSSPFSVVQLPTTRCYATFCHVTLVCCRTVTFYLPFGLRLRLRLVGYLPLYTFALQFTPRRYALRYGYGYPLLDSVRYVYVYPVRLPVGYLPAFVGSHFGSLPRLVYRLRFVPACRTLRIGCIWLRSAVRSAARCGLPYTTPTHVRYGSSYSHAFAITCVR